MPLLCPCETVNKSSVSRWTSVLLLLAVATEDFCFCLMSKVYQCIFCLRGCFHIIRCLRACHSLTITSVHCGCSRHLALSQALSFFLSLLADSHFNKVIYLLHARRFSELDFLRSHTCWLCLPVHVLSGKSLVVLLEQRMSDPFFSGVRPVCQWGMCIDGCEFFELVYWRNPSDYQIFLQIAVQHPIKCNRLSHCRILIFLITQDVWEAVFCSGWVVAISVFVCGNAVMLHESTLVHT